MGRSHRVEQGESLYSIARQYGIACWEALRDHPPNAALVGKRPHPQILHPGDVVEIPDAEEGTPVDLDVRSQFVRRPRRLQPLRLTLNHVDGEPMDECEFVLEHETGKIEGRTNSSGVLDVMVPIEARKCKLSAGAYSWELDVAHLNPLRDTDDDGLSGCQGRLRNLGYFDGEVDGKESDALAEAVALFQVDSDLPRTGKLDAATRAKLGDWHGC